MSDPTAKQPPLQQASSLRRVFNQLFLVDVPKIVKKNFTRGDLKQEELLRFPWKPQDLFDRANATPILPEESIKDDDDSTKNVSNPGNGTDANQKSKTQTTLGAVIFTETKDMLFVGTMFSFGMGICLAVLRPACVRFVIDKIEKIHSGEVPLDDTFPHTEMQHNASLISIFLYLSKLCIKIVLKNNFQKEFFPGIEILSILSWSFNQYWLSFSPS